MNNTPDQVINIVTASSGATSPEEVVHARESSSDTPKQKRAAHGQEREARKQEREARERDILKSIEHLREWGHLVSIGIMILAMFAFGIHVDSKESHVTVNWKEVPAILIVFVLAEFGVVLVSAAMEVRVSVQAAGDSTQDASERAEKAADELADLSEVGETAKTALSRLDDSLLQLSEASQVNIWDATADLINYCGITRKDCWESLANYTRSWTPAHSAKNHGAPVGLLFQSFAGKSGGVRSGADEVSCVTTDSAFAEASQKWLADILAQNKQGIVIYAITTLLPTDFALPHLWWSRNGKPYRVQTLDGFVTEVLKTCRRDDVEYRRVTIFNNKKSDLPEARVLNGNLEEHDRVVDASDLARSLDEWFIVDDRLSSPNFRLFSNLLRPALENAGLKGNLSYSEMSWERILDDLRIEDTPENNKVTRQNRRSHTMPQTNEVPYARFDFHDGQRQLIYFSQEALQTKVTFKEEKIASELKARRDRLVQIQKEGGTVLEILKAFDYLSLRDWYVQKLHRSEENGSRYWVLDNREGLDQLSIEWDQEKIPTLDLLLIGTKERHWLGAAIANLQMDSPSCLVKIVTETDTLEQIAETAETLFLQALPWSEFR